MQIAPLPPTLTIGGNCPGAVWRMIPRIPGPQERILLESFSGLSGLRKGSKLNILAIRK